MNENNIENEDQPLLDKESQYDKSRKMNADQSQFTSDRS